MNALASFLVTCIGLYLISMGTTAWLGVILIICGLTLAPTGE